MEKYKCTCDFCVAHDKYRWAVIMNCGCACHKMDGTTGHNALCCEIPNGLKVNNPYPDLVDVELCKKVIKEFEEKYSDLND